jgi:hypothetical protein
MLVLIGEASTIKLALPATLIEVSVSTLKVKVKNMCVRDIEFPLFQ